MINISLQNMAGQPIDTNCMTLTRFVLAEQRKYPTAAGNLSQLLTSIQSAVKAISAAVRRAGIANLGGAAGNVNVQGEDIQKLDILANELFINMLRFFVFVLFWIFLMVHSLVQTYIFYMSNWVHVGGYY